MTVIFVLINNQTYWESPPPRILQDQVAYGIHLSKESIWASRHPLPSSSLIHLSKASLHNTINQSFLDLCSVHREMLQPTSRMCCKEMNLAKVRRPSSWKRQLPSSYKMRKKSYLGRRRLQSQLWTWINSSQSNLSPRFKLQYQQETKLAPPQIDWLSTSQGLKLRQLILCKLLLLPKPISARFEISSMMRKSIEQKTRLRSSWLSKAFQLMMWISWIISLIRSL